MKGSPVGKLKRYRRHQQAEHVQRSCEVSGTSEASAITEAETDEGQRRNQHNVACQTELTWKEICELETVPATLRRENKRLQGVVDNWSFTEKSFEGQEDTEVKFYTGLPNFSVLMALFAT